jgi:translation elongation factor EF-4
LSYDVITYYRPSGELNAKPKVFLFDSWFDRFRGVVCLMRVYDGVIKSGMKVRSHHSKKDYEIHELGILFPGQVKTNQL